MRTNGCSSFSIQDPLKSQKKEETVIGRKRKRRERLVGLGGGEELSHLF